jgi:hypothetical protein
VSTEAIEPAATDATQQVQFVDGRKTESVWKKRIRVHAYIGEVLLLIGILAVVNLGLIPSNPGFHGISPNPLFAVILLMAARYGFRAGMFSAVVSAITYYLLLTSKINVISSRDLVSWQYAKPAVLFIVVGVIVGVLVQRHKNRLVKYEEETDMLRRDNEQLRAGEEELRDVNVELANRVVGATDTLPMLYKYAKKLNTLDTDGIFTALTELVQEVLKAGRVSVYRLSGTALELHSRDGRKASGPQLALEESLYDDLISKRKVITLHDLLSRNIQRKDIFLAGPLTEGAGGDIQAVLVVEQLEFLRYNPATVRLFGVVTDWAANVLGTAADFKDNPDELKRQENKRDILRAQRATMAPGVVSAMTGAAAAGEVSSGAKVDQAYIESPTVVFDRATPEATPMAGGGGGMGGLLGGASAGGAGGLGKLLSGADSRLFGDAQMGEVSEGSVVKELGDIAAPSQTPADRGMMQHLLTAELQMATEQGSPLAKLLAEIDGYVSGRGGKGGGRA